MSRKYQKIILSLLLVVVMSVFLAGCSNQSNEGVKEDDTKVEEKQKDVEKESEDKNKAEVSDGGTLIYPVTSDIKTLNRLIENTKDGHIILNPVNDPLYVMDQDETRFYLAKNYEVSEDGKEVTLELRDDIKWHDGEDITADDVIFTMDAVNDPQSGVDFVYNILKEIAGEEVTYEKIDDLKVKFNLPTPSSYFIDCLGSLPLQPKHAYNGNTKLMDSEEVLKGLGSGPHKVKEWRPGEALILERFDEYYGEKAPLDTIVFKVIPDTNAQDIALQNGEITLRELDNDKDIEKYEADDRFDVIYIPEGRVNYMLFSNLHEKMQNKDARKAIALALNVEDIVKGGYGSDNIAIPANSLFGTNTFYKGDVQGYEQNLEEAKKLVKETGLDKEPLTLSYNVSRNFQKETALIIQQQLAQVGIEVEVTGLESMVFFQDGFTEYDLVLNGYPASGDPGQARSFGGYVPEASGNNKMYQSQEQLELWEEADAELDESKRKELYKELQEVVKTDYSVYPIAYPNMVFAIDKRYKGFETYKTIPVFEDYTKIYFEE